VSGRGAADPLLESRSIPASTVGDGWKLHVRQQPWVAPVAKTCRANLDRRPSVVVISLRKMDFRSQSECRALTIRASFLAPRTRSLGILDKCILPHYNVASRATYFYPCPLTRSVSEGVPRLRFGLVSRWPWNLVICSNGKCKIFVGQSSDRAALPARSRCAPFHGGHAAKASGPLRCPKIEGGNFGHLSHSPMKIEAFADRLGRN